MRNGVSLDGLRLVVLHQASHMLLERLRETAVGFFIHGQGLLQVAALHGDGGQPQIRIRMHAIVSGGLLIIVLGLIQIAHEQITFAQFLVDFVIEMGTHCILLSENIPALPADCRLASVSVSESAKQKGDQNCPQPVERLPGHTIRP